MTSTIKVIALTYLLVMESFVHTIYGSKINNLQGKNLRVVTGNFPVIPIVLNSSGHIVGHSGLLSNQLLYLSAKLNFTFDIFASRENTNGVKQKNGTWNGIIGHILRGEADLGLVPFAITLERYEAIEFSGRIGGDGSGILVKYPDPSVSFTGAFDVFSVGMWIGWIISGLVIVVISISLAYVTKRQSFGVGEHNAIRAGTFAWYLFGTMVSQGDYCRFRQASQKLLAATWCLIAFVFVNVYNSTLTSYMSGLSKKLIYM
ncbi:glutamate receptor ionotropic, delta-2-like [Daphnia pulex]|uniref:glutamate receptor ionotropic, delta-2-like n=1 Tax=Daphnia pulex TaxID=6669 RepID=UPI001EE02C1E|nr:glutamate receptor ionotropic, delta-2-like [Daphnia pulex]